MSKYKIKKYFWLQFDYGYYWPSNYELIYSNGIKA